jgi:hypothetical protein
VRQRQRERVLRCEPHGSHLHTCKAGCCTVLNNVGP